MRNVTCNCDEKTKETETPKRPAAIFEKEFQDKLYMEIFTKSNDDTNTPITKSAVISSTPSSTIHSRTNCSTNAQVRIQSTLALQTPRYNGHLNKTNSS